MSLSDDASDVPHFQRRVREMVPERFRFPRVFAALSLVEELGELIEEEVARDRDASDRIEDELGDVFFSCAEIANEYGFELSPSRRDESPQGNAGASPAAWLTIAVAKVARLVLEIECFDRPLLMELSHALNDVVRAAESLGAANHLDQGKCLQKVLHRISKRIAGGTWEQKYGKILLEKRLKHN